MTNNFFLETFDGTRKAKLEVSMDDSPDKVVIRTPEGYSYRVAKKELRVLVDIMNTMDLNRDSNN